MAVNWDMVQTAFFVTLTVATVVLFACYIFLRLAIADARQFVGEVLSSEVVQAIAGAAAQFTPKDGGAPATGNVKAIVVSRGFDLLDRFMGGGH
jgi:hypothetical protein